MKIIHKFTSAALILSLLFISNFCLVECAFASEENSHSTQVKNSTEHCRESNGNQERSNSEKHDAATLCCPALVAIQNSQSYSTDSELVKGLFFKAIVLERSIPRPNTLPAYQVEFPPGASPPAVYLLTHFTHAPPVSF